MVVSLLLLPAPAPAPASPVLSSSKDRMKDFELFGSVEAHLTFGCCCLQPQATSAILAFESSATTDRRLPDPFQLPRTYLVSRLSEGRLVSQSLRLEAASRSMHVSYMTQNGRLDNGETMANELFEHGASVTQSDDNDGKSHLSTSAWLIKSKL